MKYKRIVYTPVALIVATLGFVAANDQPNESERSHESNLEKIVAKWNKVSGNSPTREWSAIQKNFEKDNSEDRGGEEEEENYTVKQDFSTELSKCIEDHQYQITENYARGKNIILNCFKATVILNLFRYIGPTSQSNFKFFNGLFELQRIPDRICVEDGDDASSKKCKYDKYLERLAAKSVMSQNKKNEYIRMYKKAMEKLIHERNKYNAFKNITEEEKQNQLNKINEGSQAFLSEILKNFGDENAEKVEEENLKRDISDPRLLSVLDAFSRKYMLKLKFYPGVAARMKRNHNGGVTFDLEINESSGEYEGEEEEEEEEEESDEGSTREIKDYKVEPKDYFDDDSSGGLGNKKQKKKKKKEAKKKVKKVKKIMPYLLIPMLIQLTLLPFVFKKLFFLAMKALFAGKVALILIGFNLLRNTCIRDEDKYAQKIRVEHYGYKPGEEYGAWVNGRSLNDPDLMKALSEEPYRGHASAS